MAVVEVHHSNQSDKSKESTKALKDKKEKPSTKVVVRRLPPTMDQETFLVQVSPLPDYDYLYLVKGDVALGEHAFSRVYINFVNAVDIFMFKEKFDNYVFVDHKGHEYPAVVEFATLQKIPRKRKPRQDPKCGTVESDPYYVEFVEFLKVLPIQEQKPEYSYQIGNDVKEQVVSTPLLDFVKQRRIDKLRIREERREQRRLRDLERKKIWEEKQKRRQEQRAAIKSSTARPSKSLDVVSEHAVETDKTVTETEIPPEKNATPTKDKKFYTNSKPRYFSQSEKSDYYDKKTEFKKSSSRKDDYNREKEYRNRRYDDFKKETPRKAKKYSEKREERKNEVKKKIAEAAESKDTLEESHEVSNAEVTNYKDSTDLLETQSSIEDKSEREGSKDDPRVQRRIRNKDRPSMAIYQPGMLSKRKVDGTEGETATADLKE